MANVSWLQEFPDPVTRICWDNYLCISPYAAEKENLREGQIVHFSVKDQKYTLPVHIQPGQDDHTLGLGGGLWKVGGGQSGRGGGKPGLSPFGNV